MNELKYTMLVADDTKVNRTMISRIFRDRYNIVTAENGLEAMEALRREKVDVMVLDIIMPEMDGFEVIAAVRADEKLKGIPIIITTAEREQSERRALELGADDFIYKPFDSVVVEKRVNNITQKYLLEREKMDILIREHEKRAAALKRQAEEDGLTGVYNRIGFRSCVRDNLKKHSAGSALLLIDVDEFKIVNDKYGHPMGDELLIRLAACFRDATEPGDVVGRIGGDEFAVFLRSAGSRQNALNKANALIFQAARIRKEIGLVENHSISVGVVYVHKPEEDLEALYQIADRALYIAKENGKGCAAVIEQADAGSAEKGDQPDVFQSIAVKYVSVDEYEAPNKLYADIAALVDHEIHGGALFLSAQEGYPIKYVSQTLVKALGYQNIEELKSVCDGKWEYLIVQEDRAHIVGILKRQLARKGHYLLEYRLRKKDGGIFYVRDNGMLGEPENGQPTLLCLCMDVGDIGE